MMRTLQMLSLSTALLLAGATVASAQHGGARGRRRRTVLFGWVATPTVDTATRVETAATPDAAIPAADAATPVEATPTAADAATPVEATPTAGDAATPVEATPTRRTRLLRWRQLLRRRTRLQQRPLLRGPRLLLRRALLGSSVLWLRNRNPVRLGLLHRRRMRLLRRMGLLASGSVLRRRRTTTTGASPHACRNETDRSVFLAAPGSQSAPRGGPFCTCPQGLRQPRRGVAIQGGLFTASPSSGY